MSCKSVPDPEDISPVEEQGSEEHGSKEQDSEEPDPPMAETVPSMEEQAFFEPIEFEFIDPAEDIVYFDLPEPSIDVPDIVIPLLSQGEDIEPEMPEPLAPVLEAEATPPEPEPVVAVVPVPPPVSQVQPAPVAPPVSPPVRQEEPQPPVFLRQPEYETPPPVRETPSLPLEPMPELPARTPPAAQEEEVLFSRIVRAAVGQLVEIPFRGTGWVYLGELSSRRGISYESRRLDPEGQSFVFRAEAPGTYALKFYRQDFIRDYILNDHVQVIVSDAPDSSGIGLFSPIDRGRVIAEPRWPLIDGYAESANAQAQTYQPSATQTQAVPPVASQAQAAPSSVTQTPVSPPVSQTAPVSQALPDIQESLSPASIAGSNGLAAAETQALPALAPDEYLRQAQREYDAGRIETALSILDRFRLDYPSGTDEAWWLYGQLLEANGPSRDIRLALEYYRRLVQEFPQSPRAPEAQRRIAYLERYYFNIR
ncbi:MAG: hypothetical protein LBI14_08895 [Treponema sp.]|nr:hypothetical protein [Treponema sp.]